MIFDDKRKEEKTMKLKNLIRRGLPQKMNGHDGNVLDFPAMFDDFFRRDLMYPSFMRSGVSTPAVNIVEMDDAFRLEMVAPGMKKQDFNMSVQGDALTISYDHEDNREGERHNWKYTLHEYNYHSFVRTFKLPETVDVDKIKATYSDGILSLTIPKKEEARRKPARSIRVS